MGLVYNTRTAHRYGLRQRNGFVTTDVYYDTHKALITEVRRLLKDPKFEFNMEASDLIEGYTKVLINEHGQFSLYAYKERIRQRVVPPKPAKYNARL